jgi:Fur family zinc uptake transcriptional regulator
LEAAEVSEVFEESLAMVSTYSMSVEQTLDRLAGRCSAKGAQLTELRRLVMGSLLTAGKPVKAYDLVEETGRAGRRLTPSTIYRVLDFLQENGLVHKVNALNAYVACTDHGGHSEHRPLLLVCRDCQSTTEINDPDLGGAFFNRLASLGFKTAGGSIEVRGQCPACAGK